MNREERERERERERGKIIKLRNLNLQTMNNIFLK